MRLLQLFFRHRSANTPRQKSEGFALAPILYLLGLVGVGAGVLFSGYSQVLRSGQTMSNTLNAKSELQGAATTIAASSWIATDSSALCPPIVGSSLPSAPAAVCSGSTSAKTVGLAFASATAANLPATPTSSGAAALYTYVTTYTPTANVPAVAEVGVFAAGAGTKVLDPWGHYYIYCRWESAIGSKNSIALISGGPNGKVETTCGGLVAGGDDQMIVMSSALTQSRAAVWQTTSSSGTVTGAQFGAVGSQVSIGTTGNVTIPGTLNVTGLSTMGSFTASAITNTPISGSTGSFTTLNAGSSAQFSVNGSGNVSTSGTLAVTGAAATTLGGTLGVTGAATLSSTLGVTGATTLSSTLGVTGATTLGTTTIDNASITNATYHGGTVTTSTAAINIGTTVAAGVGSSTPYLSVGSTVATKYPFNVDKNGAIWLYGSAILNGNVTGNVTGNLVGNQSSGTVSATTLGASGATTLSSTLNVTGATVLSSTLQTGAITGTSAIFSGTVQAASFTGSFGGTFNGSLGSFSGTVPIANGGTGQTTASSALTSLFSLAGTNLGIIPGSDLVSGSVTATQLNTTGVAAGTYSSVTVTTDGRITAGTNTGASQWTTTGSNIYFSTGSVGIGTATPNATLTLNGTMALQFGTDYSNATSSQNDVAINTASAIRYTGAGSATFTGIAAGYAGQILYLTNAATSTNTLTLANQNNGTASAAANRIITGTGANLVMANNSSVVLQYDGAATKWRVVGGSGGGSPGGSNTQVQYNDSGSFNGDTSMTWDKTNKILAVGSGATTPVATTGTVAGVTMNVIPQAVSYTTGSVSGGITFGAGTAGQMAYYSGTNAVSPTSAMVVSGSNIGIGTTSPAYLLDIRNSSSVAQLHLSGDGNDDGGYLLGYTTNVLDLIAGASFNGSLFVAKATAASILTESAGGFYFYGNTSLTSGSTYTPTMNVAITPTGSVGIGTATPLDTLDVNGTGIHITSGVPGATSAALYNNAGTLYWNGSAVATGSASQWTTSSSNIYYSTGNVGIGTASPTQLLHVYGGSADTKALVQSTTNYAAYQLITNGQTWTLGTDVGNSNNFRINNGTGDKLVIGTSGNVGIGTSVANSKLEVNGTIRVDNAGSGDYGQLYNDGGLHLAADNTSSTGMFLSAPGGYYFRNTAGGTTTSFFSTTAGISYINGTGGNVGIGNSSPASQLTVTGAGQTSASFNTAGSLASAIELDDTGTGVGNGGAIIFSAATQSWKYASIKGYVTNGGGNSQGDIVFSVRTAQANATLSEALRIQSSGNVGIGSSAPATALDVNGTIRSATGGFKFPDNTVQTTASTGGGVTANTTVSCAGNCTATCTAGYYRSGCSATQATTYHTDNYYAGPYSYTNYVTPGVSPSGANACICSLTVNAQEYVTANATCYAYCVK